MKAKAARRAKPRIKSNKKSYILKDSALYNLTTKRRLEAILKTGISELNLLSDDDNYRVFSLEKNNSQREIQAPKYDLDVVHTRIASLLVRIAMPDYVHSGVKGKSNISNASKHIGDHPVLTMDIQKFYPSVTKSSIYHFFLSAMNAPPDVAGLLAELCTFQGHIPTGSRLSMPLSYWANHKMYSRIQKLCFGKGVTMTVFVDDLTFSGANVNKLLKKDIEGIITDAGLIVHPEKSRLYDRKKPKLITGAIVDDQGLKVRNKHHKAIYSLFSELDKCEDDEALELLQRQMVGRLSAAGQVDSSFKQRSLTYRQGLIKKTNS